MAPPASTATPSRTATATPTATQTSLPTATNSATRTPSATPVATATPVPTEEPGPKISYLGIADSQDAPQEAVGKDDQGRDIFERRFGQALSIVVEARPGPSGQDVGFEAVNYDPEHPTIRPDLQVEVSHDLGRGRPAVCDNPDSEGNFGGVPAVDPPDFSQTQQISDAINDLGCLFNDGTGNPGGRGPEVACTVFPDAVYHFVDSSTTVQFCAPIAASFRFPNGDTIITARVRDVDGVVGPPRQIVLRVDPNLISTPTVTRTPSATPTPTATATEAPSPSPGANITYFAVAAPDGTPLQSIGVDDESRPIYQSRLGYAFSLVVEGRPGSEGTAVGETAFDYNPQDASVRPDLQVLVSQPLGDPSPAVCDNAGLGGIPAIDPPDFSETQVISDAINDLGCRFKNSAGDPVARGPSDACTMVQTNQVHFVDANSTVQFCARIDSEFSFPVGDTVVTARLRDADGVIGPVRQIVVRITG